MLGALFAVGRRVLSPPSWAIQHCRRTEGTLNYLHVQSAEQSKTRIVPTNVVGSREADNGDVGMGARKGANAAL